MPTAAGCEEGSSLSPTEESGMPPAGTQTAERPPAGAGLGLCDQPSLWEDPPTPAKGQEPTPTPQADLPSHQAQLKILLQKHMQSEEAYDFPSLLGQKGPGRSHRTYPGPTTVPPTQGDQASGVLLNELGSQGLNPWVPSSTVY